MLGEGGFISKGNMPFVDARQVGELDVVPPRWSAGPCAGVPPEVTGFQHTGGRSTASHEGRMAFGFWCAGNLLTWHDVTIPSGTISVSSFRLGVN